MTPSTLCLGGVSPKTLFISVEDILTNLLGYMKLRTRIGKIL